MAKNDNTEARKGRQRMIDRYAAKYPDRKWDGEGADDELYGMAADDLDSYDRQREADEKERGQFRELFNSDPTSAGLMRAWAGGTNPIRYLVTKLGGRLKEALESEEGQEEFAKAHEEYLAKEAAAQKADEEYVESMKGSLERLKAFGESHGLDEQGQVDLFLKAHQFVQDCIDGNYTDEFYQIVFDGGNYANDVKQAREEGEVNGRNAKIKSVLRKSQPDRTMPPSLEGSSFDAGEGEDTAGLKPRSVSMFGIPVPKGKK